MSGAIFTDTQWKQIHDAAIALGQLGSDVHAENLIAICAATITLAKDPPPMVSVESIGAQKFLRWNRSQGIPLVAIPMEIGVYRKAVEIHQSISNSLEIEGISRSEP